MAFLLSRGAKQTLIRKNVLSLRWNVRDMQLSTFISVSVDNIFIIFVFVLIGLMWKIGEID